MDNTGVFDDMKKITSQYYIFTVKSFILQMQIEEYFTKIEGQKYQTTIYAHKSQSMKMTETHI